MNLLMILADQHNARLIGAAGHPQAITPNLDRLAEEGVRFTRAYTQNPICTPSRVSILSGQYCHNHGVYGLSGSCDPKLPSLMSECKRQGYRTAALGKLHLPNVPQNWIAGHVDLFDDAYEDALGNDATSPFLKHLEQHNLRKLEDSWHNPHHYGSGSINLDAMVSDLPYEHTHEYWHMQRALSFIDESSEDPFCLQLSMQKPHHPLLPQRQFWEMYDENLELPETWNLEPTHRPPHFQKQWEKFRRYEWPYAQEGDTWQDGARRAWRGTLACITQVDDVIGRLIAGLEQRNLLDKTVIVYGSDHGCYHTIHGLLEKAPGICSEEVCRVPMIWRVPGVQPGVSDALVENVDLAPTMLALAGLEKMQCADGLDISPIMRGQMDHVRSHAVTECALSKSIRFGRYRYVHYPTVMFDGQTQGELYDLVDDPNETRNLFQVKQYEATVHDARSRLLNWLIETTRVRSLLPAPAACGKTPAGFPRFPTAEDGKLAASHQPRHERTRLNYL